MININNEFIVQPFNKGIKLIKPKSRCIQKNKTVLDLLQLPCSTYFETADGFIQAINERNAEFCGYDSVSQAIGKRYFAYLPQHSRETLRNHDYLTMDQGTQILDEHINSDDRKTIHIVSIKSPWYDNDGKIIGLFGVSMVAGKDNFSEPLNQLSDLGLFNRLCSKAQLTVQLTKRQSECAKFIAQGLTAKEIAATLSLSPRTIEDYIDHLKIKLNCRNKAELAATLAKIFYYS